MKAIVNRNRDRELLALKCIYDKMTLRRIAIELHCSLGAAQAYVAHLEDDGFVHNPLPETGKRKKHARTLTKNGIMELKKEGLIR